MKATLEMQDIQAIAQAVIEAIRPLLAGNGKAEDDVIFTPETLAEYLKVDTSWVYKQVSYRAIPYFKSGKYVRFRKSLIDKWIETQTVRPLSSLKVLKSSR